MMHIQQSTVISIGFLAKVVQDSTQASTAVSAHKRARRPQIGVRKARDDAQKGQGQTSALSPKTKIGGVRVVVVSPAEHYAENDSGGRAAPSSEGIRRLSA